MKERRLIPAVFFLWSFCLLVSPTAQAQAPTYKRFDNAAGIHVSKIIGTKSGGTLSVFLIPNNGGSRLSAYSSIVRLAASNGQVQWSKRFENLALADALEAKNGDLIFSGSEWISSPFTDSLKVFVLRTQNDGSPLWRQDVSFAAAAMPDTILCKEQRLAETSTGKIYFQCRDAAQTANTFIAFYFTTNGTLIWSRRLLFPQGINFTDATTTFEDRLLISGTYPNGSFQGSALVCIDTNATLRFIRTLTASTSDFTLTQILKDDAKQQYYFCGYGATDASGSYAMVMKADADIESLSYVRASVAVPGMYRCRNLPKSFGADAQGNVYCLYAGREGSFAYRKLVSGDSAYLQIPLCKFDAALNLAWRKRYVLPVNKNTAPFLTAAPQLALVNGKLMAALQTGGEYTASPPPTGWLLTIDTSGATTNNCAATDEPFSVKNITFVSGGVRANLIAPGIVMQASPSFISRNFTLVPVDTCVARQQPKSRFTYIKTSSVAGPPDVVCTGGAVSFFENAFNEPQSWQWIFPRDVDLSAADSSCFPDLYNVSFSKPGTYVIKLVVTNSSGSDTATQIITVIDPPPPPALGRDTVFCPGDSIKLFYKNPAYTTHAFYAVGGSFFTTSDTAVIKTPGTYVCAVYSPCGTAADTIKISTAQQPKAAFNTPLSCGNLTVAFTNTTQTAGSTRLSYQWDFFDKNGALLGSSAQANPSFTYTAFDTVKARLIVQSALACTKPDTVEKTFVLHPKPVASYTFTERCGNTTVLFSGTAPVAIGNVVSYAWDFGDGASDNTLSPAHNYVSAGSYTVRFTATSDAGCVSDAATQTVVVRAKPVADFIDNNDACDGKPFFLQDASTVNSSVISGYYWRSLSSGQVYTTAAINPVVSTAGLATFFYAVTSAQGCTSDTLKKDVLVESIPFASFTGGNGCTNDTLLFSSTSSATVGRIQIYQWTVSNGAASTQRNPRFGFATAGLYTVKHSVVTGNGCVSNEAVKTITVYPLPQPSFTHSLPCLNAVVNFTNTTANAATNSWQWTVNTNSFSTAISPSYSFALPGNYTVGLHTTDANGCKAMASKTITVEDFRLRLTAARNPVLPGEPVWLQTAAGVPCSIYAWTPSTVFTTQTAKAQRVVTEVPMQVQVFAQSAQGCKDSVLLLLDVYALDDVWVPSAFTPNGDGRNDLLYVIGKDIKDVDFTVYNRWGELVFVSKEKSAGWNGTTKGKAQASGTYVYVLKATKANGQTVRKKGTVTIIR